MNKQTSLKVIIIAVLIMILAGITIKLYPLIVLLSLIKNDRVGTTEISEYVIQNQNDIVDSVSRIINDQPNTDGNITDIIDLPYGINIKDISLYRKNEYSPVNNERVNFYCGGYGFGSATGYEGFYYSLSDTIPLNDSDTMNMAFLGYDFVFTKEGNGWRWKQPDGDNTIYIEHIVGNFYYYMEEY